MIKKDGDESYHLFLYTCNLSDFFRNITNDIAILLKGW